MKYEIYEKASQVKEEPVRLKLVQEKDTVKLWCVDHKGERKTKGSILMIKPDGTLQLFSGVDPAFCKVDHDTDCIEVAQ